MFEKEIVFLFTTKTDLEGHDIVADSWGGGFECFMLNLCQLSVQPFYVRWAVEDIDPHEDLKG